ncbi:MAG: hypothetical protein LBS69_08550 [Prevotellaceae bacterium]|jgi:ABC-type transporter Mla subunit MlaD|nr:hypothetical protein [Prevotellaceae bacterium]
MNKLLDQSDDALKKNKVLKRIIETIKNYKEKNEGVIADFQLIKDIVDRNSDAKEEEINAQIPVPLYLGLMGTMAGILVGLGFLVFKEGGIEIISDDISNVNPLLQGVSLAMITSIVGIFLTTVSSLRLKSSKSIAEKNKNNFLSGLFPSKLSNDIPNAIGKMSQDLAQFNNTFSTNATLLQTTIETINKSYKLHTESIDGISRLKIEKIAIANSELYDKLKKCTEEIGILGESLHGVNDYLNNARKLIEELDNGLENRKTAFEKLIEEFDKTFKEMCAKLIQEQKGVISKTVIDFAKTIKDAVSDLKKLTEEQIQTFNVAAVEQTNSIKNTMSKQTEMLVKAIDEQRTMLSVKLQETSGIISELKNLTAVKDSMSKMEKATVEQNNKIDRLVESIEKLSKTSADTDNKIDRIVSSIEKLAEAKAKGAITLWMKIVFVIVAVTIVGSGVIYLFQYFKI